MSNKTHKSMSATVNEMSRNELIALLMSSAEQLGEAQKQIRKKDKLIADFTSQRERAKIEAEAVVDEAKRKARAIRTEASEIQRAAERRVEEANAEVARKLANANAEADSIVQTRLTQAQGDIELLEAKRDRTKRETISLNANIAEQYDSLIADVEAQISSFRDMKEKISGYNVEIESEDFKKFSVSDYVTPALAKARKNEDDEDEDEFEDDVISRRPVIDVEQDDLTLEDDDLTILSESLDYYEEDDVDTHGIIPDEESAEVLLSENDLAFLEDDDFDIASFSMDEEEDDEEEIDEADELFNTAGGKSFYDEFVENDDDLDLSGIDFDSMLDGDATAIEEDEPVSSIKVPPRRRRGSASQASWL